MTNPFDVVDLPLRDDMRGALGRAWMRLAEPGAWLDGGTRLAIAAETRFAWHCDFCQDRRAALSPYAVDGRHDHEGALPEYWVEVVHRLTTDPGRLSRRWVQEALDAGMVEDEFVETVSVAVLTITIDAFALGIGVVLPILPFSAPGRPARKRAPEATPGPGWVATIAPENAAPDFADFYANESHFYIRRALTLVPEETRRFWDLLNTLYLEDPRVRELDGIERAISRAQMEFLAARASMLLGCYY